MHGPKDDDVNRQTNNTTDSTVAQASVAVEQLKEFGGVDLVDAGLRAAQRGWKIFPCNGKKRPLTEHGCYDGTTDEQQIRSWAKRWPGALWAFALPEGICVVDLDTKHGNNGIAEFVKLHGCNPEKFPGPRVRTGTGGQHLYTNSEGQDFKNSKSTIAPGIDTRSLGGYVTSQAALPPATAGSLIQIHPPHQLRRGSRSYCVRRRILKPIPQPNHFKASHYSAIPCWLMPAMR